MLPVETTVPAPGEGLMRATLSRYDQHSAMVPMAREVIFTVHEVMAEALLSWKKTAG